MKQFDIVILGGGTGGYVAAIRAAQLGKSVCIVERDKLGGTCLHRGCIPSKALLRSAELYATMQHGDEFGIESEALTLNFSKVQLRKQKIVEQLHAGVQYLMKKNKIEVIYGNGRIVGPSIFSPKSGAVAIEKADGEMETILPQHLIIATGSRPRTLPGLPKIEQIMTSDEALLLEQLPKSIVIVGGGVIGIEWASMFSDFGVQVTVLEFAGRILPTEDEDISKEMTRVLKKRKVQVVTGVKVIADRVTLGDDGLVVVQAEKNGELHTYTADKMLVSVGRQANAANIGLENTDIKVASGIIQVNEHYQTDEPHIYAIGDVIGGLQLAHVASHEGILAVEHSAGLAVHALQAHLVPRCTYSRPEVASVGWTEAQAREQGADVKTGKFNFKAIGKALIFGESDGFVKVVADAKTNDILGVHMVGPHVTDQIAEAALAQLLDATPWEIGQMIHPHPTLSEIVGEAMLAVDNRAIGM
jgi:dihydrolipoamide dehydrogenase